MTTVYQTSDLFSGIETVSKNKKDCSSCESDNYYSVDVIDFDGDSYNFQVEAENYEKACSIAENEAYNLGLQISMINIYLIK